MTANKWNFPEEAFKVILGKAFRYFRNANFQPK